jgi:hypothetical protein
MKFSDQRGMVKSRKLAGTASGMSDSLISPGGAVSNSTTIAFLTKQIKAAEADIETIAAQIVSDPPETTDQLLMLRETQNAYRSVITCLKAAIDCCE